MLTTEILNKIVLSVGVYATPKEAGLPDTPEVEGVWKEVHDEYLVLKEQGIALMPVGDLGPERKL